MRPENPKTRNRGQEEFLNYIFIQKKIIHSFIHFYLDDDDGKYEDDDGEKSSIHRNDSMCSNISLSYPFKEIYMPAILRLCV